MVNEGNNEGRKQKLYRKKNGEDGGEGNNTTDEKEHTERRSSPVSTGLTERSLIADCRSKRARERQC